jgi:flagellar hook-basal body complex protein FliE
VTTPIGPVPALGQLGQIGGIDSPATTPGISETDAPASGAKSFGDVLTSKLEDLAQMQTNAATQAQALATGQASDVSQVVMSVERASLSLQVAAQVRNKSVEAYQELLRMQV